MKVVDHVDGDPTNNDPSNIQIVDLSRTDTERLDWLQTRSHGYGKGWIVRRRTQGGVAVHESARDAGTSSTLREAIDEAMREGLWEGD